VLKMSVGRSAVKLHHKDDAMTVAWDLDASLEGDELLEALRRIVAFMDAQAAPPALPERIPGMALGMAQTAHPAPPEAPVNGWAAGALPEIPEHAKGEWELNTPEGEG
jgi:hypothetical protein